MNFADKDLQFWFWNPRGRVVSVKDVSSAQKLLAQGFCALTDEEKQRFHPGDYHAIYDQGNGGRVTQSRVIFGITPSFGEMLEVVEV